MGFPNVTTLTSESSRDFAIQSGGHQGFLTIDPSGKYQQFPVWRETWTFIRTS
jgi:hypothetical protein